MISLSPLNDKTAMKLRYERALKEEEIIEEENIVRSEFGLNSPVCVL